MRQRLCVALVAVCVLAAVGRDPAGAQNRTALQKARTTEAPPARVSRDIIGIYHSAEEATPATARLHRLLELPLNHLGYRIVYWDLAQGMPPADMTAASIGFATWFHQPVNNANAYFGWAAAAVRRGKRAIVIEQPGLLGESAELPAINGFLRTIGVEYADYHVSDVSKTTIGIAAPDMIGFEQALGRQLSHQVVRARSGDVHRHLVLADPAHVWAKAPNAVLVATSPRGGFIAPGFAIRVDPTDQRQRWLVNPFAFLTAALGPTAFPIPDTTTVSGRRVFFSHIDGDGWNGRANLPGHPLDGQSAGEVILRDLVEPYADLPVSVGLISSDIDPEHGGDGQAAATARQYYELPHVEVASHTHTHPFDWGFFSAYNRTTELQRLLAFADKQPQSKLLDRSLTAVVRAARDQRLQSALSGAQPSAYDLPRGKLHQPFSIESEVKGALDTSTQLAPSGKPARLYLWSGDTSPGEAFIRATRAAGVRNMNGGDPRLDRTYPSISYLPAIGKPVGAERQIYAAGSNDFTYTNDWKGPYDGFAQLAETVSNTELPRRLKPFNIYYHMYSASRPEALAAAKQNLALARASSITPITAATYAAIADAFYDVSFVALGPRTWRVDNRGALQTLRFDQAGDGVPDYGASVGVIGHRRHAGSLYVALDAAIPTVRVKIAQENRVAVDRPWLLESRWLISGVAADNCGFSARAQGFGAGELVLGGAKSGAWRFQIVGTAGVVDASAAADGVLRLTLPGSAIEPVHFTARYTGPCR